MSSPAPNAPFRLRRFPTLPMGLLAGCSGGIVALSHLRLPWDFLEAGLPWVVSLLAFGALGSGVAIVIAMTRGVAKPAAHLAEVARDVSRGHSRRRISPEQAGDLRPIADAFNRMMEAQQQAEERLQRAHDSLELKVQARTAELWRANKALRDESEQRARAEREFHQAQKMDALGKLAGSIAHDFNNLLTVIIGGAEAVRKQLGAGHPATAMLRTVEQAGERAAGLTRPLLTFSRSQVLAIEALSLNDAAHEAGAMLQRLLGVNIELRLDLAPDLRPVKVNATQMQQVLINLGVNARDAMEGIGTLTITTRNVSVDRDTAARRGVEPAEHWVEVAVRDTGCGMDAATKARIFEPFFTTKPVGKGTGLGLATVFGIVRQSHGFLEVDSEIGEGTTFRVTLPATEVVARAPEAEPEAATDDAGSDADETLLLVDDEEDIRELAMLTLEGRGYRVLPAANAEEAIVLGERHAGEIRALITDVVMPGMSGVQLAGVLSKVIPDLRVLFVSGHSNDAISAETLEAEHAEYLQKPYLGDALAGKVREVLKKRIAAPRAVERMAPREFEAWVN